jgi:ABC-type nitrate/sulfonate/bicarbonate transport system permease component
MTSVITPRTRQGAAGEPEALRQRLRRESRAAVIKAITRSVWNTALTLSIVLVAWQGLIWFSGLSPYVAKGPLDVLAYFTTVEEAAPNRAVMLGHLLITLRDMLVGFSAGLAAALVVAVLFQLWRGLEHAFMPVALLLASVPLISLAPLIIVITGRSTMAVAVIGGIVVLFPSLISIQSGLRSVSPQAVDVITTFGGNAFTVITKAGIPSALPALFTAVRISVPGAITGALIAEWLATGEGVGSAVQLAIPQAQFTTLWASVAVITLTSLTLYNLVRVIETVIMTRMRSLPAS